jgi:hypothetical protein
MAVKLSTLLTGRAIIPGRFLILISVWRWVNPRAIVLVKRGYQEDWNADGRLISKSIPIKSLFLQSLFHSFQIGPQADPICYLTGRGVYLRAGKTAGAWIWPLHFVPRWRIRGANFMSSSLTKLRDKLPLHIRMRYRETVLICFRLGLCDGSTLRRMYRLCQVIERFPSAIL